MQEGAAEAVNTSQTAAPAAARDSEGARRWIGILCGILLISTAIIPQGLSGGEPVWPWQLLGHYKAVSLKVLLITAWTLGLGSIAMSLTLRGRRLAAGYLTAGCVILTLYLIDTRASLAPWTAIAPMAAKFAWAGAPALLAVALFLIVSALSARNSAGAAIRSLQFASSAVILACVALDACGSIKTLRSIHHDSNLAAWSSVTFGLLAGCLAASGALLGARDALAAGSSAGSDERLGTATRRLVLGALLVLVLYGAIHPILKNHDISATLGFLSNEVLLAGMSFLAIEGIVGLFGAVRAAPVNSTARDQGGRNGRRVLSTLGGVFAAGLCWVAGVLALGVPASPVRAAAQDHTRDSGQPAAPGNGDWTQWCGSASRNMASSAIHLPEKFDEATSDKSEGLANVKWVAPLGDKTLGSPIISGGRVYIGGILNPRGNRDPAAVLWCFNEADGKLLWRMVSPNIRDLYGLDMGGICSTPTVEGDRVYLLGHLGDVLCLDAKGLSGGNQGPFAGSERYFAWNRIRLKSEIASDGSRMLEYSPGDPATPSPWDANVLWRFDMLDQARCWPYNALNAAILVRGDYLYVSTCSTISSYADGSARPIAEWKQKNGKEAYDSPSLIVLDKHTGKLLARDHAGIFQETFHGAHASPAFGEVDGKTLLFYGAGNGTCYAFDPDFTPGTGDSPGELKLVWKFNCLDPASYASGYKLERLEGG